MSRVRFVGRTEGATVPRYHLYGETTSGTGDWFVNVEPLADRCRANGWRIEPHSHPHFGQIVFVRSGGGLMTVETDRRPFSSPSVLIVPVNTVHGFDYGMDTDGWVLTVAEPYLRNLLDRTPELRAVWNEPRILSLAVDDEETSDIRSALLRLDRELDGQAAGNVIAAEACLLTVLVAILRRGETATALRQNTTGNAALVRAFRELLERRYREGWTVAQFAAELKTPVAQLRSACLQVEGQPPSNLLHDRLMVEARRILVYSDMSIAQLAYSLGFQDPAYFTRFFTRLCNESPSKYRERKRVSPGDASRSAPAES
ncbi:MAG TPA: helix-turn-helix domain-containing protein [Steroidobacter sp.]|nr:helix-turn-helix domain-containing protein [Steroidobacter sp.]